MLEAYAGKSAYPHHGQRVVEGQRLMQPASDLFLGWVLARAHAKAGNPWAISGYLGKKDQFDEAMGKFALAYADQAERDHAALKTAVRAGIVEVQLKR